MTVTDFDLGILDHHAQALSKDAATRSPADAMLSHALRRVLEAYRSAVAVPPAEERAAWLQAYVAAMNNPEVGTRERALKVAQLAVDDFRERFGGSR